MLRITRGFASIVKKPRMELTIRTPYKTLFSNFTDFKRIISKTTDYQISISNKMPPAAYILTPGRISVKPEADRKDFKGDFVHFGGWLTIHADNTCEIFLMDAVEADTFTNAKNDKLVSLANEDPKAVKWVEKIRAMAMKNFFRPGM